MKPRLFIALILIMGLALIATVCSLPVVAQLPESSATTLDVGEARVADNHKLSNAATETDGDEYGEAVTWIQTHPITSPSARQRHALAYDSARQRVVLFGGAANGSALSDTWEWDGANWVQQFPITSPTVRAGHGLAYDSMRQRVVLFGGWGSSGNLGDTWEWDGANWVQRFPATIPPANHNYAMAYDSVRGRVVLFGGIGDEDGHLDNTWEWDGTNWAQRFPATVPPGRRYPAAAYDSAGERIVLFGGYSTFHLNDTWEWDGANWAQQFPTTSPPARGGHALAYDDARKRVVLFGDGPNDTWEWDGTNWSQIFPIVSPGARGFCSLAYDSDRQRVVLFGGTDGSDLSDTWEYEPVYLIASPDARAIAPGQTTTFSVSVEGAPSPVTLTISTLPAGVSGQFDPSSVISPPTASTLVLTTSSTTPDGAYPITITGQADSLTLTVRVTLTVVTPDFGLAPSFPPWAVYPGATITYGIAITASATYTAPVAIELAGLPAGVEGVFLPNPADPNSTVDLRLTAALSAGVGTCNLVITGAGSVLSDTTMVSLTHTAEVTLTVLPSSITAAVSPGSRTVYQSQSAVYTMTVEATPGLTQPAMLSVDGLDDAGVALWPNPAPLGVAATLAVTITLDTLPGTRSFTVTASSSDLTSTAQAALIVLPANITPTVSPGSRTVYRGQTASYMIGLSATPGFTLPATLEAGQLPDGTAYAFIPATVPPGDSATLLITTTTTTPPGTHQLVITSTAADLTRTAYATLEIKVGIYLPIISKRWPPIPYAPVLDTIYGADDGEYTMTWTEPPSRLADTYTLQEATNSGFTAGLRDACTTSQQYCTVSGKLAGMYYYRVRGYNTWGYGEWSNVQAATVLPPGVPYLNPIDNTDGDQSYVVTWNPAARATSYTLQESRNSSFSNPVTVYAGAQTSWPATGKTAGTYYYRVRASGATGQSNWSAARSVTVASIYGRVTYLGNPIGGVTLLLRFYDGGSWSTRFTTVTQADGTYRFDGVPSLAGGQEYYVRYWNRSNPTYLADWWSFDITSYSAGASVAGGNFDIANIVLSAPPPGATVTLPKTFTWVRRASTTSDSYEWQLFHPIDLNPFLYTSPLGYVDKFTFLSLPSPFSYGTQYGWAVVTNAPDGGQGGSYYYNPVTFSGTATNLRLDVGRARPFNTLDPSSLVEARKANAIDTSLSVGRR